MCVCVCVCVRERERVCVCILEILEIFHGQALEIYHGQALNEQLTTRVCNALKGSRLSVNVGGMG